MSLTFDVPQKGVFVADEPDNPLRPVKPNKSQPGGDQLKLLRTLWSWLQKVQVRRARKRLRLCESVPLGDKRFVAVVQVDDREFLIAGASNSVSMLTELNKRADFSAIFAERKAGVS